MTARIIAEVGLNSNGVPWLLLDTIRTFADEGATDIKIQVRDPASVYSPDFLASPRKSPWGTTQAEQKRAMEFADAALIEASGLCRELHVDFSASCWDLNSLERFVRTVRPAWLKVASPFLTWPREVRDPLLRAHAATGLPLFVSTGMCGLGEIEEALSLMKDAPSIALMLCTSAYPASDDDVHLRTLETLRREFALPVGLSYHGRSPHVVTAAVGLGASCVEVHVTLSRRLYGSDQAASWEPDEFGALVRGVRDVERALGSAEKRIRESERAVRAKLMRKVG